METVAMRYFDPHIHMLSRTTDDYEAMAAAGIVGVVEPAYWQGQPRTHPGTFIDYFDALVGWERFRAAQFGIRHYCTIGLNPKESNDVPLAERVLEIMPRWLEQDGVLAIGEIGYDDITPEEERFFAAQLELAKAHRLPALIHTPHRDKVSGTQRSLALVREVGIAEEQVIIDHLNALTLPLVLDSGCWRAHSVYPHTKMSAERMVKLLKKYGTERMVVNSAADWGRSDPLEVPKTGAAMRAAGFCDDDIDKVLFRNPIEFFAQSGRISIETVTRPVIDQTRVWEDNSVLRGQTPVVENQPVRG
jgi:predicted metal-dependent TIM-barrel fold hydrolase